MNRRVSLRLKLALWSAALAGGALLGFALLSSWLIYQAKLDRLDAGLKRALPLARSARSADQSFDLRNAPSASSSPRLGLDFAPQSDLAKELGLPTDSEVGLLLINRAGEVVYQSPQWPLALTQLVIAQLG